MNAHAFGGVAKRVADHFDYAERADNREKRRNLGRRTTTLGPVSNDGMRRLGATALSLGLTTFGCGSESPGEDMLTSGAISSASFTSAGTGDGGATEGTADSADGSGDGPIKLDVASMPTGGQDCIEGVNCEMGCVAVDLLFVIDNSLSMSEYQVALSEAFPGFAQTILGALPEGVNVHVAVTSTEMGYSNEGNTTNCDATGAGGQPAASFYVTPDTAPSMTAGAQGRLYPANAIPYFDIDTDAPPADVQALSDWFADAATIGENGSNVEMSAAAAAWATDPVNAPTNMGFLRDDGALLVIFVIQDEPDQTPVGESQVLIDKIAAAKQQCGGMDCVVGGGFVNQFCLNQSPLGDIFAATPVMPVTATLPPAAQVNAMTFTPVLEDTLAQVIVEACATIEPPG